ncbi:molybdopterin biosynthesis protein [Rhodosalinus sediminis]|uniref:Molybdopterin biosynthesis protein n=1 Tax=Rhodosalinus sediminis TaxID=1940533 RepID=A0A3D9BZK7_9RHOB|nr:molybdopterin-binding protein [Rhodosalinus sediminis]REC58826.1 molybdopterin biosynthesis protein [Rhodosalinus sediminis]
MKFGPVPLDRAQGALLAHSVRLAGGKLKKGQRLGPEHLAALAAEGHAEVTVARPEPGDVDEDAAAARLAAVLVPDPADAGLRLTEAFTGRVNLIAGGPGVVVMEADRLHALNAVHPMITLATVPPFQQMAAGGMVATVKIISYAVPGAALEAACAEGAGAIRLARPVLRAATLIVTEIPGGAGEKGVPAIAGRLEALGLGMRGPVTVPHATAPLAEAVAAAEGDLVLILTGSATSDAEDVAPRAVRQAGGTVERFGMPVDPGNLLFLGQQGGRPVIGLPGCARSPALNGADWVLARVACGLAVTGADIAAMGVGGLLKEIPSRPQPRAGRKG